MGESQILDYSYSQIVAIETGKAKIQNGQFKLIHVIELEQYQNLVTTLETIFRKDITKNHPLFPYLIHELQQIQDSLENLKPLRNKRSIDIIGKTWKWIAGNPDHEDFEIIESKINNVLKNNNNQVIINNIQNERINNITNITNKILSLIQKENRFSDQIAYQLQYRLKLIKEELINIRYAIHWAKLGIINSLILSKKEIKITLETLDKENIPYNTPEEALDFATIKIISSTSLLFYITYIPLTTKEIYSKLLLKSIKRKNIVNEILFDNILKNNENIFGIKKICKSINNLTICNQNNIVDIKNSTCIPNMLKSLNSSCNVINNQHIPTIDEISQGILLLNQFNGIVEIEKIPHHLNGTFLIKFHNCTVTANGQLFISKEQSYLQVLPAILQPSTSQKELRELLSLEMMKEIQINNTKTIALLQTEKNLHQTISYSLITTTLIILSIMAIKNFIGKSEKNKSAASNGKHFEMELKAPNSKETADATEPVATEKRQPRQKFYEA
jgi:hypothetical protein